MRIKLQTLTTIVCVAGILLGMACKKWFPEYWFDWYPIILVAYWLMEMVISFILEKHEDKENGGLIKDKAFMRNYMIVKMVKMFVTLVLVAIYLGLYKEHQGEFVGSAIAFYLINLGIETYVVTAPQKDNRMKRKVS